MAKYILFFLLCAIVVTGCERKPGQDTARAQRFSCVNNLKQIGLALRVWEGDHDDKFPFDVSTNAEGTMELCAVGPDGFDSNVAAHLGAMSNELNTPKILVCPKDKSRKPASDFASLRAENITYRLRTGTNISEANPKEILLVCPIDGNILHCDGTVEKKDKEDDGGGMQVPQL